MTAAELRALLASAPDGAAVALVLRGHGPPPVTGGEVGPEGVVLTTSTGRLDVLLGPPRKDPSRCRCGKPALVQDGECRDCDEVSRAACDAGQAMLDAQQLRPARGRRRAK